MKTNFLSITIAFLLICTPAWAGKKEAPPNPYPSAETQQNFTNDFWKAQEAGPQAAKEFSDKVNNQSPSAEADQQVKMFNNLVNGKASDGTEAKGFHGDPSDPGPSDWSDWEVEKNGVGQVTGFKEKDFDKKDTDGDGKISKEERDEWNKKKQKEDEERGGPPGHVHKNPDWDKDGDKKPDPGFALDCFNCYKGPGTSVKEDIRCHGSEEGACSANACKADEECEEYPEKSDMTGETYFCHNCNPLDACGKLGYFSDGSCEGQCASSGGSCVSIDVDKKNGQMVPANQTRERGSTLPCFVCKKTITIEYYILIIETPYERFVLSQNPVSGSFKPSSIMALAKADPSTGKIANVTGDLKNITDFMGGFNVGFGLGGIQTTGKLSMDQLTSSLKTGLGSGGSYGANCFDDVEKDADKQAASQGTPTSQNIKEGKQNNTDKGKKDKAIPGEQIKKAEEAGTPAVSGPVVACGQQNGNKVLKVYDGAGRLVDTITQAMLKANPNVLLEKMGLAQSLTDKIMAHTSFDFAGYVEKFTGIPLKQIQSYAAQVQDIKSKTDAILAKKKNKKVKEPAVPIVPNDPLYQAPPKKEKGFFGGEAPPQAPLGMQSAVLLLDTGPKPKAEIPDQYNLRKIGFTSLNDANSAWNVMDVTQKNVVVAVVDSGLDLTHPDGPQYIWSNPKEIPGNKMDDDKDGFIDDIHGWNFLDENNDLTDRRGHGTFVTGIIAAKWNNGIGIAGINPGAVIMPIKVADDEGQTNNLAIYQGINYAVNHGAKIINVSLGGRTISRLEQQAVERAYAMGALVILAAGNNNENLMTFGPASSKHALTVGMLDADDHRSNVSNWGPNLALVAPGEQIYSLCSKDIKKILPSIRKFGYYRENGTSFTAPQVTAVASLIWAKNPQLSNEQVADIILSTAKPTGEEGWTAMTGSGLLDASAALRASPDRFLKIMITNVHINRDLSDRLSSVDIYGTVQGQFKEFTIEAGKGKLARSFTRIAGPFKKPYNYQFITRLVIQDVLRGSKEWIIRLKVIDEKGQEHLASMPFTLPDK